MTWQSRSVDTKAGRLDYMHALNRSQNYSDRVANSTREDCQQVKGRIWGQELVLPAACPIPG